MMLLKISQNSYFKKSPYLKIDSVTSVSCEFCEIVKNIFFYRIFLVAAYVHYNFDFRDPSESDSARRFL